MADDEMGNADVGMENGDAVMYNGNADADNAQALEEAPRRGPVSVGRSLEITTTAEICMEHLEEKLKLLDYEREFCRRKKPYRKPLARTYFALPVPAAHQSEQFFYFVSLAAWLLQSAGVEFPYPKEFDEPIATCTSIVAALKKLGFAMPAYQPSILRQGMGKEVVGLLDAIADYVLEARAFTFKRPVYPPDGYEEDADVDDDAEFLAPDMMEAAPMEDTAEEEAYMDVRTGPEAPTTTTEEKSILVSKVDPTQWKLEVERVAPKLRITLPSDARDWRSHLDTAHEHKVQIEASWPPGKAHLERMRAELSSSLDKLLSREKFLNEQFEQVMRGYRVVRDNLLALQETYNKRTEGVSERNNELHRIQEQLEDVKRIMEERGSNMTDTSPVMRIKQATKKLQEELKEMEVRIGVVSHTLLSVSLKDKHRLASIMSEELFDL